MIQTPLRFVPFLRPMVWGGRKLGDLLNKKLPSDDRYGESWEISDHLLHRSVVASGLLAGQTLRTLMEREATSLFGPKAANHSVFPWLVKFLDACDWLSVQVHPDERGVGFLCPGEGSKTEVWFVLDAAPRSRIYAGLLPGTDESRLRNRLITGQVTDCLWNFEPRPGDCIFLPAGTVHAVGGGVFIAEIQQTSDATFRLFDWNRRDDQGKSRTLHIEESMACIDWNQGPVHPVRAAGFNEATAQTFVRQRLVSCPYFLLDYIQSTEPILLAGEGRLQTVMILKGDGNWELQGGLDPVARGEVWLLPAFLPPVSCRPNKSLSALVCTLP